MNPNHEGRLTAAANVACLRSQHACHAASDRAGPCTAGGRVPGTQQPDASSAPAAADGAVAGSAAGADHHQPGAGGRHFVRAKGSQARATAGQLWSSLGLSQGPKAAAAGAAQQVVLWVSWSLIELPGEAQVLGLLEHPSLLHHACVVAAEALQIPRLRRLTVDLTLRHAGPCVSQVAPVQTWLPGMSCRAIEAAADGCGSDVAGLSFWWSNCLHLRWMLWAMSRGEGEGTLDEFDWVMQARVTQTPSANAA